MSEKVIITLEENASTGYMWGVVDPAYKVQYSKTYDMPATDVIGTSSTVSFELEIPIGVECSLVYKRPWEGKIIKRIYFKIWDHGKMYGG